MDLTAAEGHSTQHEPTQKREDSSDADPLPATTTGSIQYQVVNVRQVI
jgi:hypothetical protein